MTDGRRPSSFYALAAVFGLFVAFLYGPLVAIVLLSFQGPDGGLTFPMIGWSTHWFGALFEQQRVGDFKGSFLRSLGLGVIVMTLTVGQDFSLVVRPEIRKVEDLKGKTLAISGVGEFTDVGARMV